MSITSPLMPPSWTRSPILKKPPNEIASHPATLAMTSCRANAIPAPATPKATERPPSRLLKTVASTRNPAT